MLKGVVVAANHLPFEHRKRKWLRRDDADEDVAVAELCRTYDSGRRLGWWLWRLGPLAACFCDVLVIGFGQPCRRQSLLVLIYGSTANTIA